MKIKRLKDDVMWCSKCEDLIDSIVCYEVSSTKNTLELKYGFDDDKAALKVALYDNEDDEIIEKLECISICCKRCNLELNTLQHEFINKLMEENDL